MSGRVDLEQALCQAGLMIDFTFTSTTSTPLFFGLLPVAHYTIKIPEIISLSYEHTNIAVQGNSANTGFTALSC